MTDPFVQREWQELCQRLHRTAEHFAAKVPDRNGDFRTEADQFSQQTPPQRYYDLLARTRDAAELAKSWQASVNGVPQDT